ncbi:MAG: transcriptional regulator, partial [Puniceicoccaceae bacterium]
MSEVGSDRAGEAYDLEIADPGQRLQIVRGPVEQPRPFHAGLMFFTSDPRKWFPQTQTDVVHIPEGPGGNTLIEKTFSGPVSTIDLDALRAGRAVARRYRNRR